MDCEVIGPDLPAYHFGVIDEVGRAAVEGHLLGCRGCLAAFLDLKRAIETAPADRPSEAARARLRREAGAALERLAGPRRRWWRVGPVVLAAAGAAALALLALRAREPAPAAGPLDDSARPVAASGRVL
jgi:hypothetical protein